MKKIIILAASVMMTLGIATTTFASEAVTMKDQAGITPNKILYPADKLIDNIKIILCFSDDSKVNILLDIAEERSELMLDEGNQNLANTAIDGYKNYMDRAESKIENSINNNQIKNNQDQFKKLEALENKFIDKDKKSIDVLAKLQNKAGDNTKTKLEKIIEIQKLKRNAILAVKKERIIYNNARKQYIKAKITLKKSKKSGDEVAIKAAQDLLQQKQKVLDTEKQNLEKVIQSKKEVSKISIGKRFIKETKIQKRKNTKNIENKKSNAAVPTIKTYKNTTTTIPTATKSISTSGENVKKYSTKPVIKNQIKKKIYINKNKKQNQTKTVKSKQTGGLSRCK
ncbi:DUF5667 domain-containing protein [Clostridium sp. LBM24168]